jgi:hypothetical protein
VNDIETIDRLNAKAILSNIPELLAKGHFVVVEYAGLHAVGCEIFSGQGASDRASAKLTQLNAAGTTTHGELHEPPHEHVGEIRVRPDIINDDHLAQRFGVAA